VSRRSHAEYLVLYVVVIVLSFVLESSGERVLCPLPGGARALPPLCPLKAWSGMECPGCGLTRSFVALAHGELGQSLAQHRLGWALFLACAYHVFYRAWMVARGGGDPPPRLGTFHTWVARALIAGLVVNWVLKIFSI
jgi:hypothetical protein